MVRLEELTKGTQVQGILPNSIVAIVDAQWHGSDVVELTYKDASGTLGNELVFRDREPTLEIITSGGAWSFTADGANFRLASEAHRIRLAYLFDPLLAVHTSLVEPLPHQITAVYGEMLTRQPLRFLLADDPGAGKTIMAGLLMRELLDAEMFNAQGHRRKLLIFTEYRDTLNYLTDRIRTLIGRNEAVVNIHGAMGREERRKMQEAFTQDIEVQVLIATDAAGEGINLQRAHLMVNYDLPWNPNRLEQRFGRIHRIGQTEVCHLWNLVAKGTREGDVYLALLKKIEAEQKALGGKVFDVLGKAIAGTELRELLIEAIRYGDQPEVRDRLNQIVHDKLDQQRLRELLEERALARDSMDIAKVQQIREEMERAEARRLQPHFIASFFLEAFTQLGGTLRQREPQRYEISHVPAVIRNRGRQIGVGEPLLLRYERVCFEKDLISISGKPLAAFICSGHSLLDATIDLTLERHRDLLKQGTILVDENDSSEGTRALVYLEHSIQDARTNFNGSRRLVSRRMQYVEINPEGNTYNAGYAPYLNYRPLTDEEKGVVEKVLEESWLREDLEAKAKSYAIAHLVPQHLQELKQRKEELIAKTMTAVKDRLTKEINYWDHRAEELKMQEEAGKPNAKINSGKARQRADDLQARLMQRLEELEQERRLSPLPPVVVGGALVVSVGLGTCEKIKYQPFENI